MNSYILSFGFLTLFLLLYSLHPLFPCLIPSTFFSILTYISPSITFMFFAPLTLFFLMLCLPLWCHSLFLILQQLNPTLSLLQSIYRVCLSIFLGSLSCFSVFPLSSTPSLLLFPLCKSHLFPSLLYLSCLSRPFLCVPDSEPVETKGHCSLTLIDVLDRGEEEKRREGWLWADKVNSVFPSSSSPGGN